MVKNPYYPIIQSFAEMLCTKLHNLCTTFGLSRDVYGQVKSDKSALLAPLITSQSFST